MKPTKPLGSGAPSAREAPLASLGARGRHLAIIVSALLVLLALPGCTAAYSAGRVTRTSTVLTGSLAATGVASPIDEEMPGGSDGRIPPATSYIPAARPDGVKPAIHEVARTTTLFGGSNGPARVACPAGEVALSGGWNAPPQRARVFAATLRGNTWAVSVVPLGHPATTDVTAFVECLRGAHGAAVTPHLLALSVPAGSFNGGTVGCPHGGVLVGWGFSFSATSAIELTASYPDFGGWIMEFDNHGSTDLAGALAAECLGNVHVSGANWVHSSGVVVPEGTTGGNQVSCPLGTAAAGGFQYGSGGGGNVYLLRALASGWQDAAYAETTSIYLNVWAVCLLFP